MYTLMMSSSNSTVNALMQVIIICKSSVFAENCRYLMYKYNIPIFVWHRDLSHLMFLFEANIKSTQYLSEIHEICTENVDDLKNLWKIMRDIGKRKNLLIIDLNLILMENKYMINILLLMPLTII